MRFEPSSGSYTAVVQIVNSFAAVHVEGSEKRFISTHAESDIAVAQAAARVFAQSHHIPFHHQVLNLTKPIITVYKYNSNWYPAEFHSNKIRLITGIATVDFSGTQQQAINLARAVALSKSAPFIPSMGISLAAQP